MSGRIWAILVALTAIRLVVASATPLSADEAYYWVWSKALAPGYLDHPPMVALWIRAGTALCGDTALGVRLLGPLSALGGSALLAMAARDLLGLDRAGAGRSALLLNATIMIGVGTVTMTPDTPLVFFWIAALACLGRVLRGGARRVFFPAAGLAIGLAFCSKYTGFLLVLAIGGFILAGSDTRRWRRAPSAWCGAVVALATTIPVLWWNAAHGFASFAKQGGRTGDFHPERAARYLGELVSGQFGLATPIVFLLACAGTWAVARRAWRGDAGARLVALATLVPTAIFVFHAFGGRVQANWPSVIYPSACLAAALPRWRIFRASRAAALGFLLTAAIYLQGTLAPLRLPASADVTLARLGGWDGLADGAERAAAVLHLPLAADDYAVAAELAWHGAGSMVGPVLAIEPRWALFALPHPDSGLHPVLLVRSAHRSQPPDPALWLLAVPIATIDRTRDGLLAERYRLFVAVARPNAIAAALPIRR